MQVSDLLVFCKCPLMPLMFTFCVCAVHTHDYIIRITTYKYTITGALKQYGR